MALAADKTGNKDKAHRYWNETVRRWKVILEKDPGNEYIRNCIIESHKHHGDKALESPPTEETKEEAVVQYREVLKINPSDFDAQFKMASSLMEQRKFDEAIDTLKKLHAQHRQEPRHREPARLGVP